MTPGTYGSRLSVTVFKIIFSFQYNYQYSKISTKLFHVKQYFSLHLLTLSTKLLTFHVWNVSRETLHQKYKNGLKTKSRLRADTTDFCLMVIYIFPGNHSVCKEKNEWPLPLVLLFNKTLKMSTNILNILTNSR